MGEKINFYMYNRGISLLLCLVLGVSVPLVGLTSRSANGEEPEKVYLPLVVNPVVFVESIGILDTSFGEGGLVLTDLTAADDEGVALAVQRDGKLLVGGEVGDEASFHLDLSVARYNQDGNLDLTFGEGGWVRTDLEHWNDAASDIAVQPADGKILQSGSSSGDFILVRYNLDGSLDTSFDHDGWVRTDLGSIEDESKAIALQSDGKIIVAGYALDGIQYDFALVRYNPDGSLDTSFGVDGRVTTDLTGDQDQIQGLVIQPDGKIVVVGSVKRAYPYYRDFGMVRYMPDGTIDLSFGISGKVITDFSGGRDFAYAVALQPDGKIVLVGTAQNGSDGDFDFALARYTSTGSLDTTFSGDGKVALDFNGGDDDAYAVALQPDGKVIAAGYAYTGSSLDFALARYQANGSLDASFGVDGKLMTDFAGYDDKNLALVLQVNGRVVLAGSAFNGTDTDFALARYK